MNASDRAALQVRLYGYRLRITGPAGVIESLQPLFYTRCQEPPGGPVEDDFEVEAGASGLVVRRAGGDGAPLREEKGWADFFWWLDDQFFENSLSSVETLLQVHAAAVAREGRAIFLVGESHTGKTTLTFQLLLRGYHFMTDETVLVDPGTLQLRPFPRNLMVREGTARGDAELERVCRERKESYLREEDDESRWFLDPARLGSPDVPDFVEVDRIVCLEKKESGPPVFEEVGARVAVEAMVKQQSNLRMHGAAAGVDTMIRLASLGRNYRVTAVHPGEAWEVFRDHFGLEGCLAGGGSGR